MPSSARVPLNLPEYNLEIRIKEGKEEIFDFIRKKFVSLNPEEWVRQNLLHYLVTDKKYPLGLISVESGLQYNRIKKRTDILIYDRQGKPWMLIECKAPSVKLSNDTFLQAATYNTLEKAPFLAISNGLNHYCCRIEREGNKPEIVFLQDFPSPE